jgi:hypothetical protein
MNSGHDHVLYSSQTISIHCYISVAMLKAACVLRVAEKRVSERSKIRSLLSANMALAEDVPRLCQLKESEPLQDRLTRSVKSSA